MASLLKMGKKYLGDFLDDGDSKGKNKHTHVQVPPQNMAYYGGVGYPGGQPGYHMGPSPHGYHPQPQPQPQPPPYQMPRQSSQHYGSYTSYYTNNVFKVNAWEAYRFRQPSDLEMVFAQEMQKNPENEMRHAIQAEDLMNVLNNTPSIRNFYRLTWSREMCRKLHHFLKPSILAQFISSAQLVMHDIWLSHSLSCMVSKTSIAVTDNFLNMCRDHNSGRSGDGFMQWNEFLELQQCLVAWFKVFCQHDVDRSGFIDSTELIRVIRQLFGYQIQPETLETILKRYSRVVPPNGRCIIAFDDFVALSVRLRAYTDAFRKRDCLTHGGAETGNCTMGYDDFLRCVLCL